MKTVIALLKAELQKWQSDNEIDWREGFEATIRAERVLKIDELQLAIQLLEKEQRKC